MDILYLQICLLKRKIEKNNSYLYLLCHATYCNENYLVEAIQVIFWYIIIYWYTFTSICCQVISNFICTNQIKLSFVMSYPLSYPSPNLHSIYNCWLRLISLHWLKNWMNFIFQQTLVSYDFYRSRKVFWSSAF